MGRKQKCGEGKKALISRQNSNDEKGERVDVFQNHYY